MWYRLGLPALAGGGAFVLGIVAAAEEQAALVALMAVLALGLPVTLVRWSGRPAAGAHASRHQPSSPPSRRDALTGLASAAVMTDRLHTLLSSERQSDRMTALLLVDLADFTSVNRDLGHGAGDLLLRHAGARLQGGLRQGDLLARLDGGRFAVVLSEVARAADAANIADRLLEGFAEPFDLHGALWRAGVRIGVALADGGSDRTPAQLLEEAAGAVARAKAERREEPHFADPMLDADIREQRRLRHDLDGALERGELELHYQPQVDIATGLMVGVEAVCGWSHPEHGWLPPERFMAIADDAELIRPIGRWWLVEACARAAHWHRLGADLRVAVDVSPTQLHDAGFVDAVAAALAETGLAPDRLELEIASPRLLAEALAEHRIVLERLKALGVGLVLDGFGSGTASLRHLCALAVGGIKLDRELVGALGTDPTADSIVRASLGLAHSLGLTAAADGVTSPEQLSMLAEEGCALAQGSHFSHAVHPSEIEAAIGDPELRHHDDVDGETDQLTA